MSIPEYSKKQIAMDDESSLIELEEWSESIANNLLKREGIGALQEDQLAIMKFMRDYRRRHNFSPIIHYAKISTSPRIASTKSLSIW